MEQELIQLKQQFAQHQHSNFDQTLPIADRYIAFSDIINNNASTIKHGFAPKLSGNTNTFLRGDGTYSSLPGGLISYANGTTTKNAADASTVQNIPHGLGIKPVFIRLKASMVRTSASVLWLESESIYNGTTQSSQSVYISGNVATTADNTFTLNNDTAAGTTRGVITADTTNIIITWTKTGTASGTYQLLWQANT